MRALVVYESMYGNTRRVADAIADGMAQHLTVETVEVSHAPTEIPEEIDLLVIGGPTHGHGMTTASSRLTAAQRIHGGVVSRGIGIREWLEHARPKGAAVPATAFDTRIKGPELLWGSAAKSFANGLRQAGFRIAAPAKSFLVALRGSEDDLLLEGELEKARAWGADVAVQLVAKRRTLAATT